MRKYRTVYQINHRLNELLTIHYPSDILEAVTIKCKLCEEDLYIPTVIYYNDDREYLNYDFDAGSDPGLGWDTDPDYQGCDFKKVTDFEHFYHWECIEALKVVPDSRFNLDKKVYKL